MQRAALVVVLGGSVLLGGAVMARADEPATAGLKAEIEVLRDRLDTLEGKLASQQAVAAGAPEGSAVVLVPSGFHGVQISGFVDTMYTYNLNEPEGGTNTLRVFDTQSNGFMINNAQLAVEKVASAESPVGFKTELMFGTDAEVVGGVTTGLGDNAHTHAGAVSTGATDEVELQEAYVQYLAPVGQGLDVRVGKFATLHGAEVIESKDNWNISRSFLFGYAIPFTHTGLRATYPITESLSTTVGLSNGWDLVDDTNKAKTVEWNLMAMPTETTMIGGTYMFGAEQTTGNNTNQRHLLDLVASWQPTEALQLKLNYDYAVEDDGAGTVGGFANDDNAVWHGLAAYAKYALTDKTSVAVRTEYFNDVDGVRTALTSGINGTTDDDIKLYEFTITGEHQVHEHLLARLEYRHDAANAAIYNTDDGVGEKSYQDTIALEFIAPF